MPFGINLQLVGLAGADSAVAVNGNPLKVGQPVVDSQENLDQAFWAVFDVEQTGAGTVDAAVQVRWDGTNWINAITMTQLVAAGRKDEVKAITLPVGASVRATMTPGGGASVKGGGVSSVWLVSNRPFNLS